MSHKLDYLSKYYSSSSSNHKVKKKERKKGISEHRLATTVQIVDNDLSEFLYPSEASFNNAVRDSTQHLNRPRYDSDDHMRDDDEEEEEDGDVDGDGPLVVHLQNTSLINGDELNEIHRTKPSSKRRYDSDDENRQTRPASKAKVQEDAVRKSKSSRRHDSEDEQELGNSKQQNNTVYRDKHGKKLNMKEEEEKYKQQIRESLELSEKQKLSLNMGGAQKAQIEEMNKQWQDIQQSSFARGIEDEKLEDWRKNQIREGDPMAAYSDRTQPAKGDGLQQRRYKGPQPKPNRFSIQPGYRWDGVDRGNGFEDLVLAKSFIKGQEREEAYKRSTADM